MSGESQGAVIIGAAIAFAAIAWQSAMPACQPVRCPAQGEIIRYFALPEPRPLEPPIVMNWPIDDRFRNPEPIEESVQPKATKVADEEPKAGSEDPADHRRRHRWRHHRRHWR